MGLNVAYIVCLQFKRTHAEDCWEQRKAVSVVARLNFHEQMSYSSAKTVCPTVVYDRKLTSCFALRSPASYCFKGRRPVWLNLKFENNLPCSILGRTAEGPLPTYLPTSQLRFAAEQCLQFWLNISNSLG